MSEDAAVRVRELLAAAPAGMHWPNPGAPVLDTALPGPLAAIYRVMDGGSLLFETIEVTPSRELAPLTGEDGVADELVGGWEVASLTGQPVYVDRAGAVWMPEPYTGEPIPEATRFDRWLWGALEAESLVFDDEGEYRADVFGEDGELTAVAEVARARAQIKRDRRAIGPRWRLGRALAAAGDHRRARDELERVVADAPRFPWAWYDLGRISEQLGEREAALEEYAEAAGARPDGELAGFFLAHAARMAMAVRDEPRRAELAARALAADARLLDAQRDGAAENLAAGELDAAAELIGLARALAPRDLALLDLARRIDEARASEAD